jgi:hypothetical protein
METLHYIANEGTVTWSPQKWFNTICLTDYRQTMEQLWIFLFLATVVFELPGAGEKRLIFKQTKITEHLIFLAFPFLKKEGRLTRLPHCLSVSPSPLNFWTSWPIFMKCSMDARPLEATLMSYCRFPTTSN